jgi:hypothetical protein
MLQDLKVSQSPENVAFAFTAGARHLCQVCSESAGCIFPRCVQGCGPQHYIVHSSSICCRAWQGLSCAVCSTRNKCGTQNSLLLLKDAVPSLATSAVDSFQCPHHADKCRFANCSLLTPTFLTAALLCAVRMLQSVCRMGCLVP